jgi:hypothetical protein
MIGSVQPDEPEPMVHQHKDAESPLNLDTILGTRDNHNKFRLPNKPRYVRDGIARYNHRGEDITLHAPINVRGANRPWDELFLSSVIFWGGT